jgi:hypothetical protein
MNSFKGTYLVEEGDGRVGGTFKNKVKEVNPDLVQNIHITNNNKQYEIYI